MLAFILYLNYVDSKRALKLYFSLCCSLYFGFKLNLKKCPECYGDDLCPLFQNHVIALTWFSSFLSVFNPNLTKSVFYGVFNGTEVVIKRKAGRVQQNVDDTDRIQNVILCPGVSDLRFLFDQIEGGVEKKRLWLDINTSIEPLLLMYFKVFKSQGVWPLPDYHGACGDLIVEEYKGESLANFHSAEFKIRISLANQLLKMADLFTFGHPDVAFYFTDYSFDNLVVDLNGAVFLVDLDNVIISNKSHTEESKMSIHTSEIINDYKYSFSPSDICGHYISDHNYFSVCKYLLSHPEDGLLRDATNETFSEELLELLSECTFPNKISDRFTAGQKLQLALEQLISINS